MAYVTAVMLLVLCTCMVFKYGFDMGEDVTFAVSRSTASSTSSTWSSPSTSAPRPKWSFGKLLWVLLSGTIPLAAFFVERKVTRSVEPLVSGPCSGAPRRNATAYTPPYTYAPAAP